MTFLVFNYSNDVYISNLTKKIKLSEFMIKRLKYIVILIHFFLATVSASNVDTKEMLKSRMAGMGSEVPEDLMALFVDKGSISSEQFDVFYKDDTGYTRFVEEGPETFAGDNSDGKGIVRNVVSIWEYYSEEQVSECMLNNKFMAICVLDMDPLYKYNADYNKA